MAEFPFQKLQYVPKDKFYCIREKAEYIDTNLNNEKTQYSFYGWWERAVEGGSNERVLNKWNKEKIIEIS